MCYLRQEEISKKILPKKPLYFEEIKKIIAKIPSVTSISFTGGEPFLRKDIFKILAYARQKHRVGLISNLTLLNEKKIKKLLDLRLNALMFSLDGDKNQHERIRGKGTYDKTVNNARLLIKWRNKRKMNQPRVMLNTVILPTNIKSLGAIAKIALEIGVDNCNFQLLDPSLDRSGYDLKENLDNLDKTIIKKIKTIDKKLITNEFRKVKKLLKNKIDLSFSPNLTLKEITDYYQRKIELKRTFCRYPYYSFRISPYGEAYPCFNLYLGNLLKQNFWHIWNSARFMKFRREVKGKKYIWSCIGCCHWQLKNKRNFK